MDFVAVTHLPTLKSLPEVVTGHLRGVGDCMVVLPVFQENAFVCIVLCALLMLLGDLEVTKIYMKQRADSVAYTHPVTPQHLSQNRLTVPTHAVT